jgi:predicted molibdopterin-dependent oxidoreductase YjgC
MTNDEIMMNNELRKKSKCLFCSLGCGVAFRTSGEHVIAIDYDKENPINIGSLCSRGNYNFELLNHPERLKTPQIGQKKISWDEALSFLRNKLKESNPESVGIFLSSLSSNEEAYLAAKLANELNIKNISAAGDPSDLEAYQGFKWIVNGAKLARVKEVEDSEALLIIGDILTRSPVLSKRVNKIKYGKRGNKIIVIDPNKTHTSWFATTHLKNLPGTEALLLAAIANLGLDVGEASKATGISQETIVKTARDFNAAPSGTIIFVPGPNKERNDLINYFVRILAARSPNKKYITFYGFGNNLGVNVILDREVDNRSSYFEILKKIESREIKTLLMLGEDILESHPELEGKIKKLEFVSLSSFFGSRLADQALLLLPLASHLEEKGSFTLADGRTGRIEPVAPKVGTKSNLEIISYLMDKEVDFEKITHEVREVLDKGTPHKEVDLKQKVSEARRIVAREPVPVENITHFGNNNLVNRFFWYRVNNRYESKGENSNSRLSI